MRKGDETRLGSLLVQINEAISVLRGAGEPITFLYGSQAELERLTSWFCHAHPDLLTDHSNGVLLCAYRAATKREAAGTEFDVRGRSLSPSQVAYLQAWQALAYKHNQFKGTCWIQNANYHAYSYFSIHRGRVHFLENLKKQIVTEVGQKIVFTVYPPSAHERAESLLSLSEWLDDKVSEEEKRELLGLCD